MVMSLASGEMSPYQLCASRVPLSLRKAHPSSAGRIVAQFKVAPNNHADEQEVGVAIRMQT